LYPHSGYKNTTSRAIRCNLFCRRAAKKDFRYYPSRDQGDFPSNRPAALDLTNKHRRKAMHSDQKACVFPSCRPATFIYDRTVFGPLALLPGGQRHALMGLRLFRRVWPVFFCILPRKVSL
jgi:hypothetical protein